MRNFRKPCTWHGRPPRRFPGASSSGLRHGLPAASPFCAGSPVAPKRYWKISDAAPASGYFLVLRWVGDYGRLGNPGRVCNQALGAGRAHCPRHRTGRWAANYAAGRNVVLIANHGRARSGDPRVAFRWFRSMALLLACAGSLVRWQERTSYPGRNSRRRRGTGGRNPRLYAT